MLMAYHLTLKCGDTIVTINSIGYMSDQWIHVYISDKKDDFAYPNLIKVIK